MFNQSVFNRYQTFQKSQRLQMQINWALKTNIQHFAIYAKHMQVKRGKYTSGTNKFAPMYD